MKKIFIILAMIFTLFIVASCDIDLSCVPETEWSSSALRHWHACSNEGCNIRFDEEKHDFGEWEIVKEATETTKGLKERVCSVCGYVSQEEISKLTHRHSYDEWAYDANNHWQECDCGDMNQGSLSQHDWNNGIVEGVVKKYTCTVCSYLKEVKLYTVTWLNYDGAVLETDNNVEHGSIPTYNGVNPTKEANVQYTYTFSGWDKEISPVTGNITYTAEFSETVNTYTVTWKNHDGTVLKTDTYAYGATPVYNGSTPTKTGNAQYSYKFTGWSPEVSSVTGNVTYTAQFTSNVNTYTVTWENWDGTVLETDTNVAYGTTPSYSGATPTKTGNAQYSYTFAGWNPTISKVTGNVTYTAVFTETVNKYTVTWKNWDGTVLETDTNVAYGSNPTYNGSTPTKAATAEYSYTFAGWSPAVTSVIGNVTYIAVFTETVNKYNVTWKNYDGTVLKTDTNVAYGSTPSYSGATPTKTGNAQYSYTFAGWNPTISKVTGNVTYTAVFTETVNKYTVTWKNWDGTVLETDKNVAYGSTPTYNGSTPTKAATSQDSYTFTGWSPALSNVTGNVTYTAVFTGTANTYTVTWKNYDGSVLETDKNVAYGSTPSYNGSTPTKAGNAQYSYTFAGWNPSVSAVTGNVTYTAQFNQVVNKYTVTWKNHDGTVLETDSNVAYGTTPSYSGSTPTKAATAQYTYTFKGWNPSISAVTGNVTYTAQFNQTVNKYTVTWKNHDGSVLKTDTGVAYGTTPSYSGSTPTKASTAQYTYTFKGWNPSVSAVTGNVTYTAQFNQTVNKYTVTWKNHDGTVLETDKDVAYGTTPAYNSSTPTKTGNAQFSYTFKGWSPSISAVTGNVTYTAQFNQSVNEYSVTWKNWNGTVLETDLVLYGDLPSYNGKTPTRESDSDYDYEFAGWDKEIKNVTGNIVYTAVYTQNKIDKTIYVYLIAGQSNSVGYGMDTNSTLANSDQRLTNGYSNVLYYGSQERWNGGDLSVEFQPVKLGMGVSSDRSGAEIGIASAIADNGGMSAIIKCAWGATHIYPDAQYDVSKTQGTWTSPSYIENHNVNMNENPLIGEMYRRFEATVTSGLNKLIESGYIPVIKGMWWMQGEAEMFSKEMSSEYAELLSTLITDVRSFVSKTTGDDYSDMPFVAGLPTWNTTYTTGPKYQDAVRDAIISVANYMDNVSYVDCRPLNQHDNWHFDAAGQKYLGERFIYELDNMKGELPSSLVLDGKFDDQVWNTVNKNNCISATANGATVNIVGNLTNGGVLFGVTVNHSVAPDVSFDGSGRDHTYQNIEFHFNGDDKQYIYTILGKKTYDSISGGQKTVKDGSKYITTYEIFIPYNEIGLDEYPTSIDFTCSGWFESGWAWFFPENQTWNTTHTLTKEGISKIKNLSNGVKLDGNLNEQIWTNDTENIILNVAGAKLDINGTLLNEGILYGITVDHLTPPDMSLDGSNHSYSYLNIEFHFAGYDKGLFYTTLGGYYNQCFYANHKTIDNGDGSYTTTFEIYVPFSSIGYENGTTSIDFTCSGWVEDAWHWFFPENQSWNPTHTVTEEGIEKIDNFSTNHNFDGNYTEDVWSSVDTTKNISATANGANVNVVGKVTNGGVLFGVTVDHTKAPEVSTNGGTNWINYMNIEFQFNGGGTQFIYTAMGVKSNDLFYAGHKTVKNGSKYSTTMEIFIPFEALDLPTETTSVDFTCSGWFETGWAWFFSNNQNFNSTHTVTPQGIKKIDTIDNTIKLDGNLSEGVWYTLPSDINVVAHGAEVNVLGKVMNNGVVYGVTINHAKAPNESTDGSGKSNTYMNIEFHFAGVDTQFYYTTMGLTNNNLFSANHKTVKTDEGYTTTMEIYIPFTSINASSDTTSLDFTCSGWFETGWCWFFNNNQNMNPTHNVSTQGIRKLVTIDNSVEFDGSFTEDIWYDVNKNNIIEATANSADVTVSGTLLESGVLFGVTVNHSVAANVSFDGSGRDHTYQNIEFHFGGSDKQFIYTILGAKSYDTFYGGTKTLKDGSTYITTYEIYIPFTEIGLADGTTCVDFTCSGWFESGWAWFFPENQTWNTTHVLTKDGIYGNKLTEEEYNSQVALYGNTYHSEWDRKYQRARITFAIKMKAGTTVEFIGDSSVYGWAITEMTGTVLGNYTVTKDSGWLSGKTYSLTTDCYFAILIKRLVAPTDKISGEELANLHSLFKVTGAKIDSHTGSVGETLSDSEYKEQVIALGNLSNSASNLSSDFMKYRASIYFSVKMNAGTKITFTGDSSVYNWAVVETYDNSLTSLVSSFESTRIDSGWNTTETFTGTDQNTYYTQLHGGYIIITLKRVDGKAFSDNITQLASIHSMFKVEGNKYHEDTYLTQLNSNVNAVAHRGYSFYAPENTLVAYEYAAKAGFKYVECDVLFTKDNVPVLLHDDTIDRTSDGSGAISSLTLAQVKSYDFGGWKSSEFTGEKIPTFEEFISLCKELNLHPYIEIKNTITAEQALKLANIVEKYSMKDNVSYISFSLDALNQMKKVDSTARLGYVITETTIDQSVVDKANALKTGKNRVFIDTWYSYATEDAATLCKANEIELEVWTVDKISDLVKLNPYVSGVTTNFINVEYQINVRK